MIVITKKLKEGYNRRSGYDLPVTAKLLQALSIIGLLEQMLGQGLFLTESDINFRLDDDQYIIDRASFFGPSLGISLDGYLDRDDRLLDFQGVFSPVYAINAIGSVLTRKGEGLIGLILIFGVIQIHQRFSKSIFCTDTWNVSRNFQKAATKG